MKQTENLFSNYTSEKISEQVAEEIEDNLREFFKLLLAWADEKGTGEESD